MISIEALREVLRYEPTTGDLIWRIHVSDKVRTGAKAGSRRKDGYIAIRVRGHRLLAHRAAWAIHNGCWPDGNIDHINGIPSDNRIANLRSVSQRTNIENQRRARSNSSTGLLGAFKERQRFSSRIVVDGVAIRLGVYNTAEEAAAAYLEAKRKLHAGCSI